MTKPGSILSEHTKEQAKLRAQQYYINNKEKCNAANKKYYHDHIVEQRLIRRNYRIKNKERIVAQVKEQHYIKRYGISFTDKQRMVTLQGGLCAICKTPFKSLHETHLDHNHITGQVRGILCGNCNRGLGAFKDNRLLLDAGVKYLTDWEDTAATVGIIKRTVKDGSK